MIKRKAKLKCPSCRSAKFYSNETGKGCRNCGYTWKPIKELEEIKAGG